MRLVFPVFTGARDGRMRWNSPMSDDEIGRPSGKGLSPVPRKGQRIGVVLCVVSAVATLAVVVLVAGYMLFSGEAEVRDIAPAAGATSK